MEVLNYENLSYVLIKPDKFNENRKYPAILFLHGAGSRGTNVSVIKNNPFCKKMSEKEKKPFMIFCPQCYADSWFSIFEQLLDFTRFVQTHKNVDEKRIYLMGPSMGGYGTWQLAMSAPDVFAAAIPICGGGMYWNAARLKNIPIWAFHGEDDPTVFCEESKKMVDAVNRYGGNAKLTIFPNTQHNSWDPVYDDDSVFEWLLKHRRSDEELEQTKYKDSNLYG